MSKNIKVMYSKKTDNWKTPTKIYKCFENCIDPFPFNSQNDNLKNIYNNDKPIYINPPFSKLKYIPEFIKNNLINNRYIYMLIPSRTDTKYFHKLLKIHPQIIFIKGRLKYNDTGCAPFPSLLLIFNQNDIFYTYRYCDQEKLITEIKKHFILIKNDRNKSN